MQHRTSHAHCASRLAAGSHSWRLQHELPVPGINCRIIAAEEPRRIQTVNLTQAAQLAQRSWPRHPDLHLHTHGKLASGGFKATPGEVQAVQLADVGEVAADQVCQLLPLLLPGRALLRPRGPLQMPEIALIQHACSTRACCRLPCNMAACQLLQCAKRRVAATLASPTCAWCWVKVTSGSVFTHTLKPNAELCSSSPPGAACGPTACSSP